MTSELPQISIIDFSTWIDREPAFWPQFAAAFAAGLCHLGIGMIFSYPSIAMPHLLDQESDDLVLTISQASLFSSVLNIGNLISSLLSGLVISQYGQRKALIFCIPIATLGWIICGLTPSFEILVFSQIILGISVGILTPGSYNYTAEVSHTSSRGKLLAMADLLRQIGMTVTMAFGNFNLTWRQLSFIFIIFLIAPLLMLCVLPDSPRWLVLKGRHADASAALNFFRGSCNNTEKEFSEMCDTSDSSSGSQTIMHQLKLLKSEEIIGPFAVTCFLMLFLHTGGNQTVITYSVLIFSDAKVDMNANLCAFISISARVLGTLTFILSAETFNRKTLLCFPFSIAGTCMAILGVFFYVQLNYDVSSVTWIPLTTLIVFNFTTAIYYPAFMLMRSELLPNSVRSLGSGIHFCLYSTSLFVIVFCYPLLTYSIGLHWTFATYAICTYLLIVFCIVFLRETKGKSLEEIAQMQLKEAIKFKLRSRERFHSLKFDSSLIQRP